MELRRDLDYALGALLIGGVVLALVTIGLFARMTPAIERIRKDNIVTLEASQELLSVFMERAGEQLELSDRERVDRAIVALRNNLTVQNEKELVDAVTDAVAAAQAGDRVAIGNLAGAIARLNAANSQAMVEADEEAQRLGVAGAWTASVGGIALVLIGVLARARLHRRLIRPVEEVIRVLEARAIGDGHARCRAMAGAAELERTLAAVNQLLEAGRSEEAPAKRKNGKKKGPRLEVAPGTVHALALQALLAERAGPWVVLSQQHGVIAANDEAFARLGEESGAELVETLRADTRSAAERVDLGDGLVLAKLA